MYDEVPWYGRTEVRGSPQATRVYFPPLPPSTLDRRDDPRRVEEEEGGGIFEDLISAFAPTNVALLL